MTRTATQAEQQVQPMLSPRQIAARLGCSFDIVLDFIHRGELPAICISVNPLAQKRRYRVTVADLDRFIAARSVQKPPSRPRRRRTDYRRYV